MDVKLEDEYGNLNHSLSGRCDSTTYFRSSKLAPAKAKSMKRVCRASGFCVELALGGLE